jgi:DNA invertase Pin-like site-specific DNA recombinase
LYVRVCTTGQTIENQPLELTGVTERNGWQVVGTFHDCGVSGAKGRDKRTTFDALCRGVARREFDMLSFLR